MSDIYIPIGYAFLLLIGLIYGLYELRQRGYHLPGYKPKKKKQEVKVRIRTTYKF